MISKIICTYCTSIAILFSAVYLLLDMRTYHTEPQIIEEQNASVIAEEYIVKHYNGKISVFKNNSEEPLYTLDSPYVRDLPEYDQIILEEGIKANSKEELIKILEDYDN